MANTTARKPDRMLLGIGIVVAGFGAYLMLVGFGLVPEPSRSHAPGFVIACAGLAFAAGGMAVLIRGYLGMSDKESDLPPDTARGVVALAYLCGNLVVASLAMIGTWIAFGGGSRAFSIAGPFVSGSLGETIGRTIFGIAAIVTWLALIVMIRVSIQKVRALPKRSAASASAAP
ncbi:MAG: hypothetical protein AB7O50_02075 [Pseudolabrys sp.]